MCSGNSIESLTSQNQYSPSSFYVLFFIHLSDIVNPSEVKQHAQRRIIYLSQLTARRQKRLNVIDYTPSEEDMLELQTDFTVEFLINGIQFFKCLYLTIFYVFNLTL